MSQRKTKEEFISESKALYGEDAFDYSELEYFGNGIHVILTCKNGHRFKQIPRNHLRGHGCPLCMFESRKSLKYGVGVNDIIDGSNDKSYATWSNMLIRCYDSKSLSKHPSYQGCSVCPEWYYLSNFKKWFDDPATGYREGYHLDKDLIVKGNKIYSPETCCFLPHTINCLLINQSSRRGKYPLGVVKRHNRYRAQIATKDKHIKIGTFDTPEAAFLAYKKAKEQYVRELAEKYYKEGKITERVYLALLDYRVEITD